MWHVQLALFFVAASYLAMGIFLAPMIARREPRAPGQAGHRSVRRRGGGGRRQPVGEAAEHQGHHSARAALGSGSAHQGWEYLDLGRLWQILLTVGMFFWVVILVRGLWRRLRGEHPGNLPYLFLYSALSIPLFYAVGMVFGKNVNFAVMDFWRFWVVHLWVEDFLELFTTIMVAYIFVLLGVVRPATATRVVYLDIILYSIGGVIGTMHHLYFSGAPAIHMAMGACLLRHGSHSAGAADLRGMAIHAAGRPTDQGRSVLAAGKPTFPHKWAVMFLIAVGFWNFLGAGVFGFLINLPIVSYYEIGTQFTANHAHGALMGVYGMLAIGFFMFVARYFIPPDRGSRVGDEHLVLGPERRPGLDAVRQPDSDGHRATLRQLPERLLARPAARVLPAADGPHHRVAADARRPAVHRRRHPAGRLPGDPHVPVAEPLSAPSSWPGCGRIHAGVRGRLVVTTAIGLDRREASPWRLPVSF